MFCAAKPAPRGIGGAWSQDERPLLRLEKPWGSERMKPTRLWLIACLNSWSCPKQSQIYHGKLYERSCIFRGWTRASCAAGNIMVACHLEIFGRYIKASLNQWLKDFLWLRLLFIMVLMKFSLINLSNHSLNHCKLWASTNLQGKAFYGSLLAAGNGLSFSCFWTFYLPVSAHTPWFLCWETASKCPVTSW